LPKSNLSKNGDLLDKDEEYKAPPEEEWL